MQIHKKLSAALAALLIMLNGLPVSAMDTQTLPANNIAFDEETDVSVSDSAPSFSAKIETSFEGYIVKGTFKDFTPDTILVQPIYSLDGENYMECDKNWDLSELGTDDERKLVKLQNQICLYSNFEPLKSYLAKKLDCFYLKLRITKADGTICDTQPAVIDRGSPQPIPEGLTASAAFSSNMAVIKLRPFDYYGGYQLIISENTTEEELIKYLPDTLPVNISLKKGYKTFADGIIDCPVTWKPLSLPRLTAGESITIADAAETITVPKGTMVTTPMGIFELNEPLPLDELTDNNPYPFTDEVRLILNVISDGDSPTGVLSEENAGLEVSFNLKPTGATNIKAYTLSEGDLEWTEIPNLSLLESVNAHPSTTNSGYTLVLNNNLEPYKSYLEAQRTGNEPTPFFIGLKIEGGVYNGKQLILAWPDTYELPLKLPKIDGSGGNHNNAGAGNKDDSTENGQRPNLPHTPENKPQAFETPNVVKDNNNSDTDNNNADNEQPPNISQEQENKPQTTVEPDNTNKTADADNIIDNTGDYKYPNMPLYPQNRLQATNKPKDIKIVWRQTLPQYPSPNTSGYGIQLNKKAGDINRKYNPFGRFPTIGQVLSIISAKDRYPDTLENIKTGSSTEVTETVSVQTDAKTPDNAASSNNVEKNGKYEIPNRTAQNENNRLFFSFAVMTVSGLCIICIYFATSSGIFMEKLRILYNSLLRK